MKSQKFRKSAELLSAICGGLLISLPAIPQVVAQESTPKVNPCPSVFYEEPHNNRVVVPQGCPPNALTQKLAAQGLLPVSATPSQNQTRLGVGGEVPEPGIRLPRVAPGDQAQQPTPTPEGSSSDQPPQLEPEQTPIATIILNNGKVDIRFVNDTAANIIYQVIGDTAPRSLPSKQDLILKELTAPVTVTFQRDDGGQLIVTPQPSSEAGSLEVRFNEATDPAEARSALRIEPNGSVFLN